ncbi:hypothetical protein niasHS_003303 [Heterodera schachtii]|uniref:Amino acid transporter transmembrane domain-containing protein n=1 Tax=Heterodera schachtii TaxID=97005 RepID=A0ABD2KG48_HETSC
MSTNEQQNSDEVLSEDDESKEPTELPVTTFEFFSELSNWEHHKSEKAPQQEVEEQQQEPDEQKHKIDDKKVETHGGIERKEGLSYFAVLVNFLKSIIGAGVLSLPMAFKDAGIWGALVLLNVAAILNCYCMMQLVETTQFHYKRLNVTYLSYGNLAKEACKYSFPWMRKFKLMAKRLVNGSVLLLEFGFCSTYYLLISTNLREVLHFLTGWNPEIKVWLALIYVPMVFMTFIRSMRILSFFSLAGNVLMFMSLFYVLYALTHRLLSLSDEEKPEIHPIGSFSGMLLASSTMIFSYEAQTLVLPLEKKLKKPQQMLGLSGILSVGISISTLIYASLGFLGYYAYGACVKGAITQNLGETNMSAVVKLALSVSICSSFLLQMYVIVDVLWSRTARMIIEGENFKKTNDEKDKKKKLWQFPSGCKLFAELFFRASMVAVCFAFAYAVPTLDDLVPLVGSTSGMLLAFVYPALIDLFTFVPHYRAQGHRQKACFRLLLNLFLASVGLFGMVAGLYASVSNLISHGANECNATTTNGTTPTIIPNILRIMAKLRTLCFYLLILFLFGFTVFDVQKIVFQFLDDNKETDMFVVFNDTMTMPNITFCISKNHAWSHFKTTNVSDSEIDDIVQKGLKKMRNKSDFLSSRWDDLMVVDAFQTISSLNSMEVETNPTVFAMTVQKIAQTQRMANVRKMWQKWNDAVAERDVTFDEFRQKVGSETVKRSLKNFQRMGGGANWKPIQDVKITWISLRQMCFQPLHSPDEFKDIEEQDQFFKMLIVHGKEYESLDCMSIDFHGRPGEEARYLGPKGRTNDGTDGDLCLSESHEIVAEVKEIQTLLPGAEEAEEKCMEYGGEEQYGTELECHGQCRLGLIRKICKCTARTLESLADSETLQNFPLCDYAKCNLNATEEALENWEETLKNCTTECLPNCSQIRFRISKKTKSALRDDSTEVKLFWGSFEYLRLIQKQKWSFSKFVSNLGGSLGVWLGLSVVSIIQFISFMLLRLHKMMHKESAVEGEETERQNEPREMPSPSRAGGDNEISMSPMDGGGGQRKKR